MRLANWGDGPHAQRRKGSPTEDTESSEKGRKRAARAARRTFFSVNSVLSVVSLSSGLCRTRSLNSSNEPYSQRRRRGSIDSCRGALRAPAVGLT